MLSGRITDQHLDQVLLMLAARSSTGTLTVQGEDVLAIRFRNGDVLGADALKESLTHGLGRILVASGHLNRDQVVALEGSELEGTVIDHLLSTGMVPHETLAGCVRQHTYLLLLRLLGWTVGEYNFYEGEIALSIAIRPLSVEEILVRASEDDPRLLGDTIEPLGDEVLRPIFGRRTFRVMNWHKAGPNESGGWAGPTVAGGALSSTQDDDLWLTPFEDALLRSLDGLTPAHDFREVLGVDEYHLRFALHRLRKAGLVEGVGGAVATGGLFATEPLPEKKEREKERAVDELDAGPFGPLVVPPPVLMREVEAAKATSRAARWSELGSQLGDLSRLFSYILAAGLAILVLGLVLAGGSAPLLLHPFPWQEASRQRLENLRLTALHRDLIGKLKTYHILYGTFPLDPRPLIDSGLIRQSDLVDSQGRGVGFEALDQGFLLSVEEPDQREGLTAAGPRSRFNVSGDFLLDPDFTRVEGKPGGTAVQILD
jgi:hypothetical protein